MFWEFLEKHFQFSLPLRSVTIRSLCHTARMVTLLRKESNEKFSWKAKIHSFSETQNVLRVSLKSLSVFVTFTEQSRMLRSVNKGTRQQARPPPCETKSNGRGGGAERRLNADLMRVRGCKIGCVCGVTPCARRQSEKGTVTLPKPSAGRMTPKSAQSQ